MTVEAVSVHSIRSSHHMSESQVECQLQIPFTCVLQGKVLRDSRAEVDYAASFFSWYAEEAKRVEGDILSSHVTGRRTLVVRQPVGVAALFTPWNFPIAMIARKASAALASGCAVIVKPSEETPLSALALAEVRERNDNLTSRGSVRDPACYLSLREAWDVIVPSFFLLALPRGWNPFRCVQCSDQQSRVSTNRGSHAHW